MAKGENLISQMIFEHALRIRLKSDVGNSETEKREPPVDVSAAQPSSLGEPHLVSVQADAAGTIEAVENAAANTNMLPSDASLADSTTYSSTAAQSETQSSSSTGKQDKPAGVTTFTDIPEGEKKPDSKKETPILGTINNLLTSDINRVGQIQEAVGIRMLHQASSCRRFIENLPTQRRLSSKPVSVFGFCITFWVGGEIPDFQ